LLAHGVLTRMTEFDPDKFEDKYVHYFPELQKAYKRAFEYMNDRYDSELIHAIDQGVLAESEPFYEGEGRFRVELPDEPVARIAGQGVLVDEDRAMEVIDVYVDRLEREIRVTFGFEG
jgi:hypothetical protein